MEYTNQVAKSHRRCIPLLNRTDYLSDRALV